MADEPIEPRRGVYGQLEGGQEGTPLEESSSVEYIQMVFLSLLSAALPIVERHWVSVLPVGTNIRNGLLPVAVLISLAAVVAGVATARQGQAGEGVTVGWISLFLFFVTTVALYGFADLIPRATSGLYLLFFAAFALSMSSFLSSR